MGVEQGAAKRPPLDRDQRVADGAGRSGDGDACVLERRDDVESDEKLVLDNENGVCGYHSFTFPSFGAPTSHEIWALFMAGGVRGRRPGHGNAGMAGRVSFPRTVHTVPPPWATIREYLSMNWDRIEGNWKQFSGKAQQQWGKLTNDDLNIVEGRRQELVGKIQERYGIAKDEAERQVDTWIRNM
jgi:uncharacterized protein YjbJ (UPF0337 family)